MEREEDWILPAIVLAAVAVLAAAAVSVITGYPSRPKGLTSLQATIAVIVLAAFCRFVRYLLGLWRANVDHPIERIRTDLGSALQSFLPILIAVVVIGAFLSSITYLKSMIAAVSPFWADTPLAAIDRMIFVDPQAIAIALEPALPAIGLFYGLWHLAHLGGILWVIHWRGGKKSQFIISFMVTWAIGMAFAYAFASAGPIFTGRYDISIAPDSVRAPAEFLWANYKASGALPGGGISAFPSMHVAITACVCARPAGEGPSLDRPHLPDRHARLLGHPRLALCRGRRRRHWDRPPRTPSCRPMVSSPQATHLGGGRHGSTS